MHVTNGMRFVGSCGNPAIQLNPRLGVKKKINVLKVKIRFAAPEKRSGGVFFKRLSSAHSFLAISSGSAR